MTSNIVIDFNGNNNVCFTNGDGTTTLMNFNEFGNWLVDTKSQSKGFTEDDLTIQFQFVNSFVNAPIVIKIQKEYLRKYQSFVTLLYQLSNPHNDKIIDIRPYLESKLNLKNFNGYSPTINKIYKKKNNEPIKIALFTLATIVVATITGFTIANIVKKDNDSQDQINCNDDSMNINNDNTMNQSKYFTDGVLDGTLEYIEQAGNDNSEILIKDNKNDNYYTPYDESPVYGVSKETFDRSIELAKERQAEETARQR